MRMSAVKKILFYMTITAVFIAVCAHKKEKKPERSKPLHHSKKDDEKYSRYYSIPSKFDAKLQTSKGSKYDDDYDDYDYDYEDYEDNHDDDHEHHTPDYSYSHHHSCKPAPAPQRSCGGSSKSSHHSCKKHSSGCHSRGSSHSGCSSHKSSHSSCHKGHGSKCHGGHRGHGGQKCHGSHRKGYGGGGCRGKRETHEEQEQETKLAHINIQEDILH